MKVIHSATSGKLSTMFLSLRAEAVRNKNSKKVFVLLDNSQVNRMTVINPEGKVLTVPDGLFEPPFGVNSEKFAETFTPEQIGALEKQGKKPKSSRSSSSPSRRGTTSRKVTLKSGIGAEWSSAKLTFYKHKIEPLQESQSFKINVENVGAFVITKSDFCRVFNDVVISSSYWQDGSYTYGQFPEKAKQFVKVA